MFASLPFSVVLNRGLEPYGDDEEFYVGVIIESGGNSLRIRFPTRKENTLTERDALSGKYFCGT